ncbi:hypothetical protein [Aliarcobacter butzleri]|uniref:hypothetical protein n=1 Tax=Aliarcobacter butzleri TaxID=28197 RepID=UPI001269A3A0|nr:hypothetical protein [Aliarcobacter butzleri]
MKKKVIIDSNDIVIPEIITKLDYVNNRIKYDSKFNAKEVHNKIFLLDKNLNSKIFFSTYLFNIKKTLGIKEGVVIIADYTPTKDVFIIGTLDNPLDVKSLLKLEFLRDSFYDNNILSLSNWLKFFIDENKVSYVITNNSNLFKETINTQGLNYFKFKFIKKEDVEKISSSVKPFFIYKDLISIFIPSIVFTILMLFTVNFIGNSVIEADIKSSTEKRKQKSQELIKNNQTLQSLKNSDYYKNKEDYMKLSERKVYVKGEQK